MLQIAIYNFAKREKEVAVDKKWLAKVTDGLDVVEKASNEFGIEFGIDKTQVGHAISSTTVNKNF